MTIHLPDFLRGSNPQIVNAIEDLLIGETTITELSQTVAKLQGDLNAVEAGGSTADFQALQSDVDQLNIQVNDLHDTLAELFVSPPPLQGRIGVSDTSTMTLNTEGAGTPSDPMTITGHAISLTVLDRLQVLDTPTLALTITGSGTQDDPAVISGVVLAVAPPTSTVGAFRYVQVSASQSWDIVHNLGFQPNVTAIDSAGSQIWPGDVNYPSENEVVLSFSSAVGGEAYLS